MILKSNTLFSFDPVSLSLTDRVLGTNANDVSATEGNVVLARKLNDASATEGNNVSGKDVRRLEP